MGPETQAQVPLQEQYALLSTEPFLKPHSALLIRVLYLTVRVEWAR